MTNSYQHQLDVAQERLALKIASRLSDSIDELPYDISERLRAGRMQALAKRKLAATQTASSMTVSGGVATLTFGNEKLGWWGRLGAVAPLMALVVGLIGINIVQDDNRTNELAEIDSALLTDDLPPEAYTDPGFAQFIKISNLPNQ
jgi:hypothetical protein